MAVLGDANPGDDDRNSLHETDASKVSMNFVLSTGSYKIRVYFILFLVLLTANYLSPWAKKEAE